MFSWGTYGAPVQKPNLQSAVAKETPELLDLDRKNFKGQVCLFVLTLFSTTLGVGRCSNA